MMLKNILELKNVQELSKKEQKAVIGSRNQIDPHCCLIAADFYMEGIPDYAHHSAPGYLTYEERHDLWTQAFDGCMDGQSAPCIPVNYTP